MYDKSVILNVSTYKAAMVQFYLRSLESCLTSLKSVEYYPVKHVRSLIFLSNLRSMLMSAFFWKRKKRYFFTDFLRVFLYLQESKHIYKHFWIHLYLVNGNMEALKTELLQQHIQCPRQLSFGLAKTVIAFPHNQKLIACRIGLPLPFHNIKCRGNHAFLIVNWVAFIFFENFLCAFYIFSFHLPSKSNICMLFCALTMPSAGTCLQLEFVIIFCG